LPFHEGQKKQNEEGKKIEILYLKREVRRISLLFSSISWEKSSISCDFGENTGREAEQVLF